jgi:hypothetical protein
MGFTRWLVLLGLCDLGLEFRQGLEELRACSLRLRTVVDRGRLWRLKGLPLSRVNLAQALLQLSRAQLLATSEALVDQIIPKRVVMEYVRDTCENRSQSATY